MKLHPTRNKQAAKDELRGRMMTEIMSSDRGKRVLRECQEALDRPANVDEISRRLVLDRYADELEVYAYELEDLLRRVADVNKPKPDQGTGTFRDGFIQGWMECVGDRELNKTKLKLTAEAAADKYIKETKTVTEIVTDRSK